MPTMNVYESIRRDILSCVLKPGAAIYEQELAQRFGVSKSPVREALLRLQEQRLVEVRARSGYRVRPVSRTEANEMYAMRLLYEQACAKQAILHASDRELSDLRQHLTKDAHLPVGEWLTLNRNFHSAVAAIAGNSLLADASDTLHEHFDRLTLVSIGTLEQPIDFTRFNAEHAAIVKALRARKKREALTLIRAHISGSRRRTLKALQNPAIEP